MFSAAEIEHFQREGYVVARGLAEPAVCSALKTIAEEHLAQAIAPVEYEAEVQYPGAPASLNAPGGRTVRRLLQAYARDPLYANWATSLSLTARLRQLLGPQVVLSQAHHNCVMTKHPRYSTATHWHRDIRYWAFEHPALVSVWLALGDETIDNGCLLVLPGTHEVEVKDDGFDAAQFLRSDLPQNQALLATQIPVALAAGDVLFFHCRLFHAAGKNRTDATKFSPVFTYHALDNPPRAGTRSAAWPEIPL
jgi:phytanoyl-CoA hydroxylase